MVATPFLGARITSGGSPQVQRYIDAVPSNQGVTTGSLETYTAGTSNPSERVIMFAPAGSAGGEETFLFFINSQIYRSDDAGATWTLVHTITASVAGSATRSGLFIVYDASGVPWVACAYSSTTGLPRFSYSSDGVTWTETGTIAGAGFSEWHSAAAYRDTLYIAYSTSGGTMNVITLAPATGTTTFFTLPGYGPSNRSMNLVVWDGFLYSIAHIAGGTVRLSRIVGGTETNVFTSGVLAGATTNFGLAWIDPSDNNLYFAFKSSGTGSRILQITSAFAGTDITATVLAGTLPATVNGNWKALLIDAEANIGGAPDIYLYWASSTTAGTAVNQYIWNGNATLIGAAGSPNDTGGDVSFAMLLSDKTSEGSRFWTTGQKKIEMTGTNGTPLAASIRKKFRCYGGGLVTVRIYWGMANVEYPVTLATLSSPTSGSISGGTDNINVPADGTEQEVTAALPGEGFGDRFVMVMEVF